MDTENAVHALTGFAQNEAQDAANQMADMFEKAGERMADALSDAAMSGELSVRDMVSSITQELAKIAMQQLILNPLENWASGGGGNIGEISNLIAANGAGQSPVNITMNLSGVSDAQGFSQSQGQISAALARAVSQGQKYI